MDQCTHQVRLQYWKDIISKCQSRPTNQSAKSWLKENDICEQTYYVWQRRIRQEAFQQMNETKCELASVSTKETEQAITFAEIPLKTVSSNESSTASVCQPVAVIRADHFSIALSNEISDPLLARILKEVIHA